MGVVDRAVAWAVAVAEDPAHGYSQEQNIRWGNPDFDCSSFVISAYRHAGLPLKSTYTETMRSDFMNNGFAVAMGVNLATGAGLRKGDVLLNEKNHTALCIGDGKIVQASSNEFGGIVGGQPGDQTGREIYIGWYYCPSYGWDYVLRYVRDDKEETPEMPYEDAVENEDYYIVKQWDTLWDIAERFLGDGNLFPLLQQINGMGNSTTIYPGTVILLHPEGLEPETPPKEDKPTPTPPPEESVGGAGAYQIALQVLKKGDRGAEVRQTQRLLIATGYAMPQYGADGDFGSETETAVKKFQADNGLEQNGTVDKATMSKLLGL
ncbi:MAG: peptidoglycan-binding protein [Clostridia bacterium]|nr:peptidoglycan-binding protein [Clostridia bacterium]